MLKCVVLTAEFPLLAKNRAILPEIDVTLSARIDLLQHTLLVTQNACRKMKDHQIIRRAMWTPLHSNVRLVDLLARSRSRKKGFWVHHQI